MALDERLDVPDSGNPGEGGAGRRIDDERRNRREALGPRARTALDRESDRIRVRSSLEAHGVPRRLGRRRDRERRKPCGREDESASHFVTTRTGVTPSAQLPVFGTRAR